MKPIETPLPDGRREQRFAATGKSILIMPWGGDRSYKTHHVRLLDCSAHGLGIEDSDPMRAGDQFVVYLHLDAVTMVLYTVRHCTKSGAGAYRIGAQLDGFVGGTDANADEVLTSLIEQQLV